MSDQNLTNEATTPEENLGQQELIPQDKSFTAMKAEEETPAPKPKKVFSLSDVRPTVDIGVIFPDILPDYEPFEFVMRLKLSKEAQEQREQYLSLAAKKQTETYTEQCLNEVCDLITELPKGFSDLKEIGTGPKASFRFYFDSANDPNKKSFLSMVVEAASQAYWNAVQPLRFRRETKAND